MINLVLPVSLNYVFPSRNDVLAATIGFRSGPDTAGSDIVICGLDGVIKRREHIRANGYVSDLIKTDSAGVIIAKALHLDEFAIDTSGKGTLKIEILSSAKKGPLSSLLHKQNAPSTRIALPVLAFRDAFYCGFEDARSWM